MSCSIPFLHIFEETKLHFDKYFRQSSTVIPSFLPSVIYLISLQPGVPARNLCIFFPFCLLCPHIYTTLFIYFSYFSALGKMLTCTIISMLVILLFMCKTFVYKSVNSTEKYKPQNKKNLN